MGTILVVAVLIEAAIQLFLHPVNVADVRIEQAAEPAERGCIVLGDSVANQLAPPNDGRALVRTLTGVALPFDPRGPLAEAIDERCLFLTTTAGATRMADLLLLEEAIRNGSRPAEVHLIANPISWGTGREENSNFEVGFVQRFSSPTAALSTFQTAQDPGLVVRQVAMGLPSIRARGPYGQRLLSALVPRVESDEAVDSSEPASWELNPWNEEALLRLAQVVQNIGAQLYVHSAPYPEHTNDPQMAQDWHAAMSELPDVCVGEPGEAWSASYYRDQVHLLEAEIPRLTEWFSQQLDDNCARR